MVKANGFNQAFAIGNFVEQANYLVDSEITKLEAR